MASFETFTFAVLLVFGAQAQNNPCLDHHCSHGGQCIDSNGVAHCVCPHGYSGTFCQINTVLGRQFDPCANYHCANGGYCIYPTDAPHCVCPVGFTGQHCHLTHEGKRAIISRDPCVNFECQNGGVCIAPADAPYCVCLFGFSGTRCQIGISI